MTMHECPCGTPCDCPDYDDGLYDAEWCCECECPIGVGNCPGCIAVGSLPVEE